MTLASPIEDPEHPARRRSLVAHETAALAGARPRRWPARCSTIAANGQARRAARRSRNGGPSARSRGATMAGVGRGSLQGGPRGCKGHGARALAKPGEDIPS